MSGHGRLWAKVVAAPFALVAALSSGCGVEHYRERAPSPDLAFYLVVDQANAVGRSPGPQLVSWAGDSADNPRPPLLLSSRPSLDHRHISAVRLLRGVDEREVIVIVLTETGRLRLSEVAQSADNVRVALVSGARIVSAPWLGSEVESRELTIDQSDDQREVTWGLITSGN